MKSLQKQRGLTMISWILVLAIVSFCGIFAFRVVPMYAENTYVVSALKSIANNNGSSLSDMSDAEIRKQLNNFYLINNVRSEGAKNIIIEHKSKDFIVKIDYEIRANLFYNIDVVTTFENHLDSSKPQDCCKPVEKR